MKFSQKYILAAFFIALSLLTALVVLNQVSINSVELYSPWAQWLATAAAFTSAAAAIIAATLLSRTLRESQKATKLMRKQLKMQLHQGKAFMTPDIPTISHVSDDLGEITGVIIGVNWKNTGLSPAFDVRSGGASGYADITKVTDPGFDESVNIEEQDSSIVAVGNKSMGGTLFKMEDILKALADGHSGILYSICTYEDIYKSRYKAEYSASVTWPAAIADPRHRLDAITSGIKIRPWGKRNKISSLPKLKEDECKGVKT